MKWKYVILTKSDHEIWSRWFIDMVYEKALDGASLEVALAYMGENGWELAAMEGRRYIFKRPIKEGEE